ncbi:MAG: hypothetical protein C5B49_14665 [Bdellovibrio sp.]|nr:MAG: hypothetical protein C5B49_14665 [Bdellovibrio sp.]
MKMRTLAKADKQLKRPRVLLIDPPDFESSKSGNLHLPLGLLAIANYVTERHLVASVRIVDLSLELIKNDFIHSETSILDLVNRSGVLSAEWDIIGLTTHFTNTLTSISIGQFMKSKYPSSVLVLGGIHATSCYGSLLKEYDCIDAIILGEGELAFSQLCSGWSSVERKASLNLSTIPNIARKSETGEILVSERKQIQLDTVGSYKFDFLDLKDYRRASTNDYFWVETGRGCIYRCGFCISSKHWGHKTRYFPIRKIVDDLATLKAAGISKVKFTHDQFTFDKENLKQLCGKFLSSNLQIEWGCYSRVDEFPIHLAPLMKEAGCRQIFIGLESKLPSIQSEIRKRISNEKLEEIIAVCHDLEIELETNIILGFPDQNEEKLLDELGFAALLKLKSQGRVSISSLSLYPGTRYFDDPKYRGLFKLEDAIKYPDLYSFQFEHRRKFWGMSVEILAECFRTWATFFPRTIQSIMGSNELRTLFTNWLNENSGRLTVLHGEKDSGAHLPEILRMALTHWTNSEPISNLLVFEGAIAIMSDGRTPEFTWNGKDGLEISLQGPRGFAKIKVGPEFTELDGRCGDFRSFLFSSHKEEIWIEELEDNGKFNGQMDELKQRCP